MRRLGVAVIGTGFIGPVHAEAVRRNPSLAELKVIAGVSEAEAKAAAENLGIPEHTGDFRTLLQRDDIDVIHICTPNHLHYPMAKECLLRGKHVLCEKPLARTAEEAAELTQLAAHLDLQCAVNYNLRYYPMVQEMRARNEAGRTGNIFSLQGAYLQDWLLYDTDYSWRLEPGLGGASRAVADIGTHWMDMAQYVTGKSILKVLAQFGRMHETRRKPADSRDRTFAGKSETKGAEYIDYTVGTEDYAQILLMFEDGVLGNLTVSQVAAGYKNFMEFRQFGTDASMSWNSEHPNFLKIGHRNAANEVLLKDPSLLQPEAMSMSAFPGGHQEGYGETLRFLLSAFYRDLLGEEDGIGYPSFADGMMEMYLCEAILSSMHRQEWVMLDVQKGGTDA